MEGGMGFLDQLGQAAGGMFSSEDGNASTLMQAIVGMLAKNGSMGESDLVQAFQRN